MIIYRVMYSKKWQNWICDTERSPFQKYTTELSRVRRIASKDRSVRKNTISSTSVRIFGFFCFSLFNPGMRKDCFAPKARLRFALSHPAGWDSRHSPPPAPPCLAAPLTARPCWGSRRRPLLQPGWWPVILPAPLCSSLLPAACWTSCSHRLLDLLPPSLAGPSAAAAPSHGSCCRGSEGSSLRWILQS